MIAIIKALFDELQNFCLAMIAQAPAIIPLFLAIMCTLGFFSAIGVLAEHAVPETSHDAMMLLVGSLGSAWIGVMSYYFGSSSGSAKKTDIMASQAKTLADKEEKEQP